MGIKYTVNSDFFKKWSRNMAYVLGYLFADGSLEDASYLRGKYLRITSCDRTIIETIKKTLNSEHIIAKLPPTTKNGKNRYFLRIGDHTIYDDLMKLGLMPRKSLTMQFPRNIHPGFIRDFIRGYFDGDGTLYLEKRKNSSAARIIFTSGSKEFLEGLSETITGHCNLTRLKKVYNSHRSYQLIYKSNMAMAVADFMFGQIEDGSIYLERKYKHYIDFKSALS